MSRTVSAGLQAHLAESTTTLATCWKVTRADSQVFAFTDHDIDLTVSSVVYKAETGYARTAIQANSELSVDNLDVESVLDDSAITEDDIFAGLWDYAQVEIFIVNWADLTQGILGPFKGLMGEVSTSGVGFKAELRGLAQLLQQSAGRVFTKTCDADLGDSRCGINLASWTTSGAVVSTVTSNRVFTSASLGQATGFFDAGTLTWTSGNNSGLSAVVKTFTSAGSPSVGTVTLQLPMPYDIEAADQFTIIAGCLKRFEEDCIAKFDNAVNFRGFPHIPGLDVVMSGKEA